MHKYRIIIIKLLSYDFNVSVNKDFIHSSTTCCRHEARCKAAYHRRWIDEMR